MGASAFSRTTASRTGCGRRVPWAELRFEVRTQRVKKHSVLQVLSLGLKIEQRQIDHVNVTATGARREILLDASFDEPSETARRRCVLKG
jgi:hypothetical protein